MGTGKSSAISILVQHLTPRISAGTDPRMVYYYISRKQVRRSESIDIFRCLIAQLAWSFDGTSIAKPVQAMYDKTGRDRISERGKPSIEERVTTLHGLCNAWPRTTIIIDALYECLVLSKVLHGLGETRAKATSTLQILLSTRTHINVPFYFADCEKIQIDEGEDSGDVEIYVREDSSSGGSQNRRLLDGRRPDLEARLVQILITRAQGMFIWVKRLQCSFLETLSIGCDYRTR